MDLPFHKVEMIYNAIDSDRLLHERITNKLSVKLLTTGKGFKFPPTQQQTDAMAQMLITMRFDLSTIDEFLLSLQRRFKDFPSISEVIALGFKKHTQKTGKESKIEASVIEAETMFSEQLRKSFVAKYSDEYLSKCIESYLAKITGCDDLALLTKTYEKMFLFDWYDAKFKLQDVVNVHNQKHEEISKKNKRPVVFFVNRDLPEMLEKYNDVVV